MVFREFHWVFRRFTGSEPRNQRKTARPIKNETSEIDPMDMFFILGLVSRKSRIELRHFLKKGPLIQIYHSLVYKPLNKKDVT